MKTRLLAESELQEAVGLLRNGELVAIPTETVYGLAADASNPEAVKKIFEAKGRPQNHPLILHIDSVESLSHWAEDISSEALKLAQHFWPGPLTMLFHKKKSVSAVITAGLDTVAIRIPQHPVTQRILRDLGTGLVAPSANFHKKISPTQPSHVLRTLSGRIAAVIDAGSCAVGIESTILDMTQEKPVILRYGAITPHMIEHVLGYKIICPAQHAQRVSGNMRDHYQPEKKLFICSMNEIIEQLALSQAKVAVLHRSPLKQDSNIVSFQMPQEKEDYAHKLYDMLHQADSSEATLILVESLPQGEQWCDLHDRLSKASTKID